MNPQNIVNKILGKKKKAKNPRSGGLMDTNRVGYENIQTMANNLTNMQAKEEEMKGKV